MVKKRARAGGLVHAATVPRIMADRFERKTTRGVVEQPREPNSAN
jgi:hypothetical protein